MKKIKVALIGYGRWGKIIRPYIEKYFKIKYIVNSKFDLSIIWKDEEVKAVFIITPIETHYKIVREALLNDKDVFVEKPLTSSLSEARDLQRISNLLNKQLYTDYPWMFSPTLKKVKLNSYENLSLNLYRKACRPQDSIKYSLLPHIFSWLLVILPKNIVLDGTFKINAHLNAKNNFTDIYQNNYLIWKPDPIKDKHNLDRSVKYFRKLIDNKVLSNIEESIIITKIIEDTYREK